MAQIVEHADGVYLNMTEDAYYADWALGSSALDILRTSPPDWWWESPFNELKPQKLTKDEDASKAMIFGSAVHVALLEGMDVFNSTYGILPDKFTHPKALDTSTQIQARLKELGEKVSGAKPELIERLLAADPSAEILDVLVANAKATGRKLISRWDYNKIALMERLLMGPKPADGAPRKLTSLGKAFQGGLSEVSVFWTDERGIRQRARFDKLKPNVTIDLKTFSNWKSRDFGRAMLRDAALKNQHVQAAHYEEGRRQLRRLVAEGKIFAPRSDNADLQAKIDKDVELLKTIATAEVWKWVWVFYKTDGAPRAKGVIMDWKKTHAQIIAEGAGRRDEALNNFLHYKEFYGLSHEGRMWADPEQIWEPAIEDWPIYAMVAD